MNKRKTVTSQSFTVDFQDQTLPVTHQIKPRLKHAYLLVDRQQGVILKSPPIPAAHAREIVLRRAAWILRKLAGLREGCLARGWHEESKCLYLGEACPVQLEEAPLARPALAFNAGIFSLRVPAGQTQPAELLPAALDAFYRRQARLLLPPLVQAWSERMGLYPSALTIKKQQRRWGSCSSRNHIRLNYGLVQLPPACIELVVVHELAHIRHKNHSASFWRLVEEFVPDYKVRRQRLKTYL